MQDLIKAPRFGIKFKGKELRFQVMFSVDRLARSALLENLFKSNQTLLPRENFVPDDLFYKCIYLKKI
jgi:hypothetical protein